MKDNIGQIKNTQRIIKDNNFNIKKKFGQNFLIDQNILVNIVNCADINENVNVIEIGPGLGSLTEHIASKANKVLCYEIDSTLLPILDENLKEFNNITIVNQDILKANISEDVKKYFNDDLPIYLVANLPYYITTPIILNLLKETRLIKRYVMMMQLEVAQRICSKHNSKDYSPLSIVIQYKADASKVLDVPNTVFIPKPEVSSAVIRLDLHETPKYQVNDEDMFLALIKQAFGQRRKTLTNNLKDTFCSKEKLYSTLDELDINKSVRAEALSIQDFINIVNKLT